MALAVAIVVVLVIALFGGKNSVVVLLAVIGVAVLAGIVVVVVGKNKTGLSITPEWKPEATDEDYDDDDDLDAASVTPAPDVPATSSGDETEPVRRLDAQILGADLSKLGQVVSPKLAKSYAVGTLVLEGTDIVWEPGATSRAAGIENLVTAPDQVSVVESATLWGSWGLLRVATAGGDEWCMRVPGSVDLAPAFAELGLTLRKPD
ncbi:MAG: hypothetical protein JST73_05830 [Actinobacteria bacterium]|nr:hypothetical protein [Actinomycetota bacterium]